MAVIEKEIELVGSKGRERLTGLFDSGATYSCIDSELARRLATVEPLPQPLEFETAEAGRRIQVTQRVTLDFWLSGYRFSDEFFLVPHLSERLIFGTSTMQKWRLKRDFEQDEIIIDPRVTKLRLMPCLKST